MSLKTFSSERRSFFKYAAAGLAALAFTQSRNPLAFADAPSAQLSEEDPTAKALGYHKDATKVDPKKWAKRSGKDAKAQKCGTCQFYTAIDKKTGKCQIFPNNTVMEGAWCNSWSKKA
jgi:hypothetical protein